MSNYETLILAKHFNANNNNNNNKPLKKTSSKTNKKRKVSSKELKTQKDEKKSTKVHYFDEKLFTPKTYFQRNFASTSNLSKSSLFFDSSTNSFKFAASESSQKRLLRMTKKLEELNLNSSLFMASSSSWTSLHKSNSFLYLDNKFQNNDTTQHAKLAFYNQLLSNKGRKDNFNYQKLSSDFSHVAEKNKSYTHLKELLGYPDSFKQSSEASYDSEPDEATQRRKNESSKQEDSGKVNRHISIKHFASVENKYKSTPENLNNLGKQASFLSIRPSNLNNNQKNLFKIEESYKDSSSSIYSKVGDEEKHNMTTAIVKKPFEPKIKSKKNSFRLLQQPKKFNLKDEPNRKQDIKTTDILSNSEKLDSERQKMKNSFPNLFSNKKKSLVPSEFHENSGIFSMASNSSNASLTNAKKRPPINIANFENMSLMSKYNLNLKFEEAFKFTKLLENRTEKSGMEAFRLKFENLSNKNDPDSIMSTHDELGKASTLDYEEIPNEINNNKVPINTQTREKIHRVNFFPSIVPPPPSVETSLSTANNNNFKSQALLNFKNLE